MPSYLVSEPTARLLRSLTAPRGGVELVPRPVRLGGASSPAAGQWRLTATRGDDGATITVGPGLVAWGGGVTYANPGAELGPAAPGDYRVVWTTAAPPVPLVHDPRWPTGDAPACECPDCTCPAAEGDGSASGGDSGALLLVDDSWTMPEGTTDVREIGRISIPSDGAPTIEQLQRDTIVALAIVGRTAGGDDPEDVPPCGHPLNADGDAHPLDAPPIHAGAAGYGDHPLDNLGPGGYSPDCADAHPATPDHPLAP